MKKIAFIVSTFFVINTYAQETVLIDEQYDENKYGWFISDEKEFKAKIEKGKYILNNKTDGAYWTHLPVDNLSPDDEDFTIETAITQVSGIDNYGFGLVWSLYNDNSAYQKFYIASNKLYMLDNFYNNESHKYVDWSEGPVNKMKTQNVLKIEKRSNQVTAYLNGTKLYQSGDFNFFGSKIGYYLGNKMEIEIDYIKVTKQPKKINLVDNFDPNVESLKLSDKINSDYQEVVPVISADGKFLFCVRKGTPDNIGTNDRDDVWYAMAEENGEWGALKNFGPPINNDDHNFVISISPDNNTLLVGNTYNPDGTALGSGVSISHKTQMGWEVPKKMEIDNYVNDNDYVAYFLGSDNKTLLMCIENSESLGEKDVFVSFLKDDNNWTKPKNLGNIVNTSGDENTPYLAADNKTLYYSTNGLPGYGYTDVFMTKRLDDSWTNWSEPKNMGSVINTPYSELGFFMTAKGDFAYVSSGGDIYKIGNSAKPEPVVLVSGKVFNKKTNEPMSTGIKYFDLEKNQELGIAMSDPNTGEYKIVLPVGKLYSFLAEKDGFYSITENLDVHKLDEYTEMKKDLYLSPIEKGEVIRLNNIFFETNKSELKSESFNELDRLVEILKKSKDLKIEISGHTDDVGSDEYNLKLSDDRAKSVLSYLTSKDVEQARLISKGYGETMPQVANDTEENKSINRRVEFKVL